MPVIRPEHERSQRGRQPATPDTRANTDDVVAAVELRLHENGPAVDLAQVGQGLLEWWKSLLLVALHVADDITIAHGVIRQLAPQSQLHDVRVEPEPSLPLDSCIQIKRQGD